MLFAIYSWMWQLSLDYFENIKILKQVLYVVRRVFFPMISKRIYGRLIMMDVGDNDISGKWHWHKSKSMCVVSMCSDFPEMWLGGSMILVTNCGNQTLMLLKIELP